MHYLLQAATMPQQGVSPMTLLGAVWTIALLMLGWLQKRSSDDRTEMKDEIKDVRETLASMRGEVTVLNTHVGVEGNGILTQLAELNRKFDRVSELVFSVIRRHDSQGT